MTQIGDLNHSVQPTIPVVVTCLRCGEPVLIPAGLQLRIPGAEVPWCHEIIDMHTGQVFKRGDVK